MENATGIRITQKDYYFSIAAGLLIGLLFLPVLKTVNASLFSKIYLAIVPFFLLATPLGLRIAFFIGKKIAVIFQIAKFGVIGVGNVLMDLGALSLITIFFSKYLSIDAKDSMIGAVTFYSLFKTLSFIIANINSYFWNKYWTFEQSPEKKAESEFLQFFAVSVVGILINVFVASFVFNIIVGSFVNFTGGQLGLIGAIAGSIAGLVWNFVGYKLWVFRVK